MKLSILPIAPTSRGREGIMEHYRVNKVVRPDGEVLKKKDILASNDREAIGRAADDDDCPTCDVYRRGTKIGSIT
jgi:hypothetical protein